MVGHDEMRVTEQSERPAQPRMASAVEARFEEGQGPSAQRIEHDKDRRGGHPPRPTSRVIARDSPVHGSLFIGVERSGWSRRYMAVLVLGFPAIGQGGVRTVREHHGAPDGFSRVRKGMCAGAAPYVISDHRRGRAGARAVIMASASRICPTAVRTCAPRNRQPVLSRWCPIAWALSRPTTRERLPDRFSAAPCAPLCRDPPRATKRRFLQWYMQTLRQLPLALERGCP